MLGDVEGSELGDVEGSELKDLEGSMLGDVKGSELGYVERGSELGICEAQSSGMWKALILGIFLRLSVWGCGWLRA